MGAVEFIHADCDLSDKKAVCLKFIDFFISEILMEIFSACE